MFTFSSGISKDAGSIHKKVHPLSKTQVSNPRLKTSPDMVFCTQNTRGVADSLACLTASCVSLYHIYHIPTMIDGLHLCP